MLKKIGILTIIDNNNYGNRLQNYALQQYCNKLFNTKSLTLNNNSDYNFKNKFFYSKLKGTIKLIVKKVIKWDYVNNLDNKDKERYKNFLLFDKNINYYNKAINANSKMKEFDYIIVGSDQIWNPNFKRLSDVDVLKNLDFKKRISYAASFGISEINKKYEHVIRKEISRFKAISVRENSGKEIIEKLTGRNDVEVLVDPTMLLTADKWDKVSKKPSQLKSKKYILNYFLGNLSEERKKSIEKFTKENNCDIVNLMDKNESLYACGPSEFLYLIKNAFLICTDSFHGCIFSIIYDRPFVAFDREEENMSNMGSRIDTLIDNFRLKDRRYNGKDITSKNLNHNYSEAYKILEKEREKSFNFLKKSLIIK